MSPKERVAQACARFGETEVAQWCARLLTGVSTQDDPSIVWLGGRNAEAFLARGLDFKYWPRVWAARGLLYAWDPGATPAVVSALDDPAWRVREMALKVVRLRELGEAAEKAASLTADGTERVRKAAVRALARVGEAEHASPVRDLLDDPFVRRDAGIALDELRRRLDRPI